MDSPPPDVSALLAALTSELDGRGLRFMLIGGQAVLLHGQARFTADPASASLEAFVRLKGAALDWAYLDRWVAEFAPVPGREGMPAALARLKAFRL